MLQTSLLLMNSLNKTETPIFLSVVCSLFPKAIFLTFILTSKAGDLVQTKRTRRVIWSSLFADTAF